MQRHHLVNASCSECLVSNELFIMPAGPEPCFDYPWNSKRRVMSGKCCSRLFQFIALMIVPLQGSCCHVPCFCHVLHGDVFLIVRWLVHTAWKLTWIEFCLMFWFVFLSRQECRSWNILCQPWWVQPFVNILHASPHSGEFNNCCAKTTACISLGNNCSGFHQLRGQLLATANQQSHLSPWHPDGQMSVPYEDRQITYNNMYLIWIDSRASPLRERIITSTLWHSQSMRLQINYCCSHERRKTWCYPCISWPLKS